jgi:hypothetical protein
MDRACAGSAPAESKVVSTRSGKSILRKSLRRFVIGWNQALNVAE